MKMLKSLVLLVVLQMAFARRHSKAQRTISTFQAQKVFTSAPSKISADGKKINKRMKKGDCGFTE